MTKKIIKYLLMRAILSIAQIVYFGRIVKIKKAEMAVIAAKGRTILMKKQYDYYECRWPNYEIVLYHDGIKVGAERIDLLKLDQYLEDLEAEGYTHGYTEEDVEKARKRWEHIYENRIQRNIKPRCHKCIYELQCSKDKDNERNCPDYKRDAADGGYYG